MGGIDENELDRELLGLSRRIDQGDISAIQRALKISDRRIRLLIQQTIQNEIKKRLEQEMLSLLEILQQELETSEFEKVVEAMRAM